MEYLPPPAGDDTGNAGQAHPVVQVTPRRTNRSGWAAAGAAVLAFLAKFKLALLLGAKLLMPAWTFLFSLWLSATLFGWKVGIVLLLLVLAHELGHYFAFRAYGLPVQLPIFTIFGAFTAGAPPADMEHDAYIALAGPLTGLALSAACYGAGLATGERFWFACADLGAFLNLFNMIPVPPLDGGRVIGALHPALWIAGIALLLASAFFYGIPLFLVVVVGLFGLPQIVAAMRGKIDPRAALLSQAARLRVGLWYLGTLGGLFYVMARAYPIAMGAQRAIGW